MCDGTGITPKLAASGGGGGGSGGPSAPFVSFRQLERAEFQKDFLVIDIREAEEVAFANEQALKPDNCQSSNDNENENKEKEKKQGDEKEIAKAKTEAENKKICSVNVQKHFATKYPDISYVNVPMGKILSGSFQSTDEFKKLMKSRKKIGFLCPRGGRAKMAADWFVSSEFSYDVYVITLGISAILRKFADDDDYTVVLTNLNNDPEKVGIALNLCNAAAAKGKSVTLILMHEAVYMGTQRYHDAAKGNKDAVSTGNEKGFELPAQIELPKPFNAWKGAFDSLVAKKGQILCCTSCMKKRGISPQNDLIKEAIAIQGPNIVDISLNAGFFMQFM